MGNNVRGLFFENLRRISLDLNGQTSNIYQPRRAPKKFDTKKRYLQLAFNSSTAQAINFISQLEYNERIIIEVGTPLIKKEGVSAIRTIRNYWPGFIVADIKIADGAEQEVEYVYREGADAVTVLGCTNKETIDYCISVCKKYNLISMVDMIGVSEPHRVLLSLKKQPDVIILHKARDQEHIKGFKIPYKQVNKIRSKYGALISAAGGVDLKEARSAIFNGANIVVVNVIDSGFSWVGINSDSEVLKTTKEFLKTIE